MWRSSLNLHFLNSNAMLNSWSMFLSSNTKVAFSSANMRLTGPWTFAFSAPARYSTLGLHAFSRFKCETRPKAIFSKLMNVYFPKGLILIKIHRESTANAHKFFGWAFCTAPLGRGTLPSWHAIKEARSPPNEWSSIVRGRQILLLLQPKFPILIANIFLILKKNRQIIVYTDFIYSSAASPRDNFLLLGGSKGFNSSIVLTLMLDLQ